MADWNLGSVGSIVHQRLDDIPTSFSGAPMWQATAERLSYVNQYLGTSIGSTAISDKYQGTMVAYTMADTLMIIETQGSDATDVKIGEFTIKKGQGSSAVTASDKWETKAEEMLAELKGDYNYYKAQG